MNKKYIVRFIQDPTGLVKPALDLWTGFGSDTLFDTEEEAYARAKRDPHFNSDWVMLILPVYVPWTDSGHRLPE